MCDYLEISATTAKRALKVCINEEVKDHHQYGGHGINIPVGAYQIPDR
jgi:hypothetical protein